MLVRPLILSPPILVHAIRGDPADLLVHAGEGAAAVSFNNASAVTAPILCIGAERQRAPNCAPMHNIESVISFFLI